MPSADAPAGPFFREVDTVTAEELRASGEDVTRRATPVLIKGATRDWPAATRWDFEHLATVCGCGAAVCGMGALWLPPRAYR